MTILDEIVSNKRDELVEYKRALPIPVLKGSVFFERPCLPLASRLRSSDTGIIAEFKRRSPSKGFINEKADVRQVVAGYEACGASGISVLADRAFFAGGPTFVQKARTVISRTPVLFKEFVVDPYQIYLAKASGADAVLLIASLLDAGTSRELTDLAHVLGLEVLYELYDPEELDRIPAEADMVGVNNRNLRTFEVDVDRALGMLRQVDGRHVKVAESGLSDPQTVLRLRREGVQGFLMGERFMHEADPALALKNFITALKHEKAAD
ncbi:MAG: indole-3-glycerol-phosphate synthase [Paludibacteraceae bacterium]|nr:indole-3-glycerol-phosphate synthase [Paludibacteraceae bacterium]